MRILFVSQYFWPENFRINDLAKGFVERGHDVTVLTGIPNYPEGRFFKGYGFFKNQRQEHEGIRIIRVPLWPRGRSRHGQLVLNYISFVFTASIMGPFLCRQKFDVIFVYETSPITVALPAILLKKIKKVPVVMWVLDLWPESLSATEAVRSRFILDGVERFVRFIYRHCERIFVASEGYIPSIVSRSGKLEKIRFFPNWAEEIFERIQPMQTNDISGQLPGGFRLMFAGNMGVSQDFETILAAAEKLKTYPDIHWFFLGDGRMLDWVKREIRSRGLDETVHLLGRHPLEAMPRFFAFADAMLVTLKRDPAFSVTIPGRIQSYLACGKPMVAALDGAGRKLVEESGAGFVSPAGDAAGLAEAVLKMARFSEGERKVMGQRGQVYYRGNFSRQLLFDRVENWIHEVVSMRK